MKDESPQTGRHFIIPIGLTIITILLGLISFHTVFPDYPFLRKLYYTFQLFSMESGDRFYENGSQPMWVVIIFNLARFLAVATLFITIALAILSVLRYRYFLSRVKYMKGHTILCGLGDIGKAITDNYLDKKKLVIIEKDETNEHLVKLKKDGVKVIEANALDITLLKRLGINHARCLLALTGDDFDNLTIINNALELIKDGRDPADEVTLAANILSRNLKVSVTEEWKNRIDRSDCELKKSLDIFCSTANKIRMQGGIEKASSALKDEFEAVKNSLSAYDPSGDNVRRDFERVKLFNINQLAARFIFLHYPPDRFRAVTKTNDPVMQMMILGWSEIGEELLKLCIQNCHYINRQNTKIALICHDAEVVEDKIRSRYKNTLNVIDFRILKHNPHYMTSRFLAEHELTHTDVIYVCSKEDRFQVSYSSRARELFSESTAVIRPFYKNMVVSKAESLYNLHSFNILNKVSEVECIIGESLDHKAVSIHHHWLKQAINDYVNKVQDCLNKNATIPEPKPTLVPWYMLDEEIRDDNRSVVEHLNLKLRSVGQLNNPEYYDHPGKADINYGFLDDKTMVEQLAEMEHRRWMATKYLYGWEYAPQRNVLLKEHESLVEFIKLDESTKRYDREQVSKMKEIIELK